MWIFSFNDINKKHFVILNLFQDPDEILKQVQNDSKRQNVFCSFFVFQSFSFFSGIQNQPDCFTFARNDGTVFVLHLFNPHISLFTLHVFSLSPLQPFNQFDPSPLSSPARGEGNKAHPSPVRTSIPQGERGEFLTKFIYFS